MKKNNLNIGALVELTVKKMRKAKSRNHKSNKIHICDSLKYYMKRKVKKDGEHHKEFEPNIKQKKNNSHSKDIIRGNKDF